jgi:hypothetical protein
MMMNRVEGMKEVEVEVCLLMLVDKNCAWFLNDCVSCGDRRRYRVASSVAG